MSQLGMVPTPAAHVAYINACEGARLKSLEADYRGCGVHLNVRIGLKDGYPQITGYYTSDWTDDSTVATFVNGEQR